MFGCLWRLGNSFKCHWNRSHWKEWLDGTYFEAKALISTFRKEEGKGNDADSVRCAVYMERRLGLEEDDEGS